MSRYLAIALVGIAACILAPQPSHAQNYPDHPVKLIVPYPPGGPADTVARVTTQGLGAALGGSLIIENVAGAGGRLGTKEAGRAPPDGYTLFLGSSNEIAITPALYKNLDYDPVKELVAVTPLVTDSLAIVVNPSLPVHTLKELAVYASEHPGKLTSGSTLGIGPHMLLLYFEARMKADIVFVPYKGAAPALADAMGNQIQVTASAKSVLLPLVTAGKLRALAVTDDRRWPEISDVPTLRESGLDGFPPVVAFGLMAPTGTPPAIIAKIDVAQNARLKSPELQAAIAKVGMVPSIESRQDFAKVLNDQVGLWKAVAEASGAHLE